MTTNIRELTPKHRTTMRETLLIYSVQPATEIMIEVGMETKVEEKRDCCLNDGNKTLSPKVECICTRK